jgi:hypothetical protein
MVKSLTCLFLFSILCGGLFLFISANFIGMAAASSTTQISLNTQNFTYVLPDYNVTYKIVKMPPHDSQAVNPYAYNIVVYGPPPYPIQIEFYDQMWSGTTEKRSAIMPTNALSTSIGCVSYPTQITMKQVGNESVSPTPTSNALNDSEYFPNLSVPEFTVEVNGRSVSLIIKNQPFTSYVDDDWIVRFYYNVRLNGKELYRASEGYPAQSSSEYTTISYSIRENADSYLGVLLCRVGNTLTFQVEAMIGYVHRVYDPEASHMLEMYPWVFTGEKSGWSEPQTVTLESSATTTPDEPTEPEPTEPEPEQEPDTESTSANATQISISVDTSSIVVGSAVNIYGTLTDTNGNPLPNKSVTLSYSVTDNDWVPIGSGITNAAGQYYIQWVNTASGTFTLKAEWNGDDEYLGTSATTTLTSLPYQDPYVFYIESNSTITALTFDATESELVFTASGASGTTGYVKATIPKDLLYAKGNWSVLVDEKPTTPTVNEDANKTYLHFTYGHSTKTIKIRGTEATPDFPSWTPILLILTALAVAVAIYIAKTPRNDAETNHNQLLRGN